MKHEIKVPSAGESVTQATVGEWQKKEGDYVYKNDVLVIMETDKASMDLSAEHSGKLKILKKEGEDVNIGEVIAELDSSVKAPSVETQKPAPAKTTPPEIPLKPSPAVENKALKMGPAVKKLIAEKNLKAADIPPGGPKDNITKEDVLNFINKKPADKPAEQRRERMSTLRRRIAERLVESQQNSAVLTTFNEIDMSKVMALRAEYKETFQKKHNLKLGFMGFFIKASVKALKTFPKVNAFIEQRDIIYNQACHIGVAVSTDKGLVVPVIKNADALSLPELERAVLFSAEKAREGNILPDDLTGGTFTISNGGVFGSLMSTPILNPPQSGILGMHKIEQRPVAIKGKMEIRPMMYIALSYDHRIVDGKESVGFLLKIKECVEDPFRLLIDV